MAELEEFASPIARRLREVASAYPEVSESPSCVNRSFKAANKSFLFLGEKPDGMLRIMVKLDDGLDSARKVEAEADADDGWSVGKGGWVTGNFTEATSPDVALLTAWIGESYRLQASKKLLAQLDS